MEGHPVDIRQALANLLLNASDAVGEAGKISIEIDDDDRQGTVRTIIADNGPGIPEHIQEKIFEPFFSTKAERGVGLGLWVAREVVTKHGGKITLRSTTKPRPEWYGIHFVLPQKRSAEFGTTGNGLMSPIANFLSLLKRARS